MLMDTKGKRASHKAEKLGNKKLEDYLKRKKKDEKWKRFKKKGTLLVEKEAMEGLE